MVHHSLITAWRIARASAIFEKHCHAGSYSLEPNDIWREMYVPDCPA
jgi:hypothetical protein